MAGGSSEYKKGLWTVEEDKLLADYVKMHGKGKWNRIAKATGLKRCGKSCRLRWMNYLSPTVKKGDFSEEEDDLIIRLHKLLGNRWSLIAGRVPGRTDNQVKNHWNTHLSKKLGVKKGKINKLFYHGPPSSSTTHSSHDHHRMDQDDSSLLLNNIKYMPKPQGTTEEAGASTHEGIEDSSHGGVRTILEASKLQEPVLLEEEIVVDQSSILFSSDDLIIDSPSFMEFIKDYSLDFSWNI